MREAIATAVLHHGIAENFYINDALRVVIGGREKYRVLAESETDETGPAFNYNGITYYILPND